MCAHSMVHSCESRTGQQQRVLQGEYVAIISRERRTDVCVLCAGTNTYYKYRNSQGSIPSRDGGRIRHRLMGTIVHHARYPHTEARMCSAALMYIRAACAASHACAGPRDNEPWADRPGRSHRERIMTERLIQDNETPPLSASLKMVVKSATTSVREFKSGCKV
jgi:hypothetical protein